MTTTFLRKSFTHNKEIIIIRQLT